ncbi:alpha/beta hydrolase family protein [Nonomuraea jabiensis]|uniref:Acetyl esterase/lipase n=1 Tax=Nonomuraea jabiensis TaxID=882448 RepID=A0A7W9GIJ1_9ACTN|nr:alpha/beta hydrolase fold domain-containing protein [Nonomuraea jabiensis]MBB5784206.1 acetyl esterase/lipase [Nonomuraea jabiensis]
MIEVLVVVGPGLVADAGLLEEIAAREFAAAAVSGTLVHARDASDVLSLLSAREGAGCAVVLPGPSAEVRSLIGRDLGAVVWVDIERADGVTAGKGAAHLHGRGIGGLGWGIRHAVHRVRHPSRRIAYGPLPEQWGELYLPDAEQPPVVMLVHGGYWRSIWAADIMGPLCADLAGRGLAVWNLEYRRPDLHGWDATTADVAAGLAALATALPSDALPSDALPSDALPPDALRPDALPPDALPPGALSPGADGTAALDLTRVAVVGHSAGAQLALRAVADAAAGGAFPAGGARAAAGGASAAGGAQAAAGEVWPAGGARVAAGGAYPASGARAAAGEDGAGGGVRVVMAVSLAGVLDLVEGDRRWVGTGAVGAALGGRAPEGRVEPPYADASPLLRLPLRVRQLVVQGAADDLDLVDFSRRYARAAEQAGDEVTYLEMPGDHFDVINPATPIWQATARALVEDPASRG